MVVVAPVQEVQVEEGQQQQQKTPLPSSRIPFLPPSPSTVYEDNTTPSPLSVFKSEPVVNTPSSPATAAYAGSSDADTSTNLSIRIPSPSTYSSTAAAAAAAAAAKAKNAPAPAPAGCCCTIA